MATRNEIVEALERLETHCRAPLMSIEARTGWMRDWCDDLKDCDVADVNAACQKWRNGDERKFPLPGQLKAVIRSLRPQRTDSDNQGGAWRELTDAEYQALTIREKIRYHQICVQQCLRKAGPMWSAGRHREMADMPQSFHDWRAKASNHGEEARRLQGKLNEYQEAS